VVAGHFGFPFAKQETKRPEKKFGNEDYWLLAYKKNGQVVTFILAWWGHGHL
jgi:hypothetical protein